LPITIVLILLLTSMLDVTAQAVDIVATARINMRSGPGITYSVVAVLEAGTSMHLDGRYTSDRMWLHVTTPTAQAGWIARDLVSVASDQINALPVLGLDAPVSAGVSPSPVVEQPVPVPANPGIATPSTMRQVYLNGQALGNRANVFSKVGDSITQDIRFLNPIGWGVYNLRDYAALQPVVNHFLSGSARTSNAFANESLAATFGWTSGDVLAPASNALCQSGESWLHCEYRLNMPSVALIMIGTNDVQHSDVFTYRANLATIVQLSLDMGVIPVVSTIPNRVGYESSVGTFNQAVIEVAATYGIPIWDYHAAMEALPGGGLSEDGIHPSFPFGTHDADYGAAADFTPDNLRFGYTVRNLTALQALDAVWRSAMQ
jgi:lysophospholipase L1-like esterase